MAVAAINMMAAPHRTWLIRFMCFLSLPAVAAGNAINLIIGLLS